jgi:molybdopterin molybdotransferase
MSSSHSFDSMAADIATQAPLTTEQALALLLARAEPIAGNETVNLPDALDRVLAEPVISPIDQPGWDHSAMDGYALRAADLDADGPLPISQRVPAGSVGEPLVPGTTARIFTGAPMPEGADTVVIQEDCEADGGRVSLLEPARGKVRAGANIRRRGEDIAAGETVLQAGVLLGPQHLGLAASVGAAKLKVRPRLRVAVFASGDELVMPGEPLGPGQIYNSNRFMLAALLRRLGCELIDLGIVADDREATVTALAQGAAQADLVVASGGVSVGEEDHVRPAVEQLGRLDLWRVAMRPGKPLAFGHIGDTPFVGSPGNPVSLFVTFCLFARPFIRRMQGVAGDLSPRTQLLPVGFALERPVKRRDYRRARVEPGPDGQPRIQVFPSTSSAAITSLTWAEGLVDVPAGESVARGQLLTFLPFSELLA